MARKHLARLSADDFLVFVIAHFAPFAAPTGRTIIITVATTVGRIAALAVIIFTIIFAPLFRTTPARPHLPSPFRACTTTTPPPIFTIDDGQHGAATTRCLRVGTTVPTAAGAATAPATSTLVWLPIPSQHRRLDKGIHFIRSSDIAFRAQIPLPLPRAPR